MRHPHLRAGRARAAARAHSCVAARRRTWGAVEVRPPSEFHRLQLTVPLTFMYCALCHKFRSAPRPNTCAQDATALRCNVHTAGACPGAAHLEHVVSVEDRCGAGGEDAAQRLPLVPLDPYCVATHLRTDGQSMVAA